MFQNYKHGLAVGPVYIVKDGAAIFRPVGKRRADIPQKSIIALKLPGVPGQCLIVVITVRQFKKPAVMLQN
jgi:hypothetical protein